MGVKVRCWPDGWYCVIHINGERYTRKHESEKEALDDADRMEERIRVMGVDGLRLFTSRTRKHTVVLFKDYASEWLQEAQRSGLKASTVDRYESSINHQLVPYFGKYSLDEIDYPKLKAFSLEKAAGCEEEEIKPLSRDSIRLAMVAMRQILVEAKREGLIESNPVKHLTKFYGRKANKKPDPLTTEELAALEAVFVERFPEYYEFFMVGWKTGLRFGEERALQWSDIDFRSKKIYIRRNWPANQSLDTPKTVAGVRKVDLAASLVPLLKGLRARRKSEALQVGREMSDWIFLEKGDPINHSRLSKRIWKRACSAAEVRFRGWHQLRHTYASQLLMLGANPLYVSKQLGHAKSSTTLNIYAHWIEQGGNDREVDLIDNLTANVRRNVSEGTRQELKSGEAGGDRTLGPRIKSS